MRLLRTHSQQAKTRLRRRRSFFALSRWTRAGVIAAALLGAAVAGCNRAHYRHQADAEAYSLVNEKSAHPHWDLANYTIEVDPRSRMFDPFHPDREPMPLDDPAAHKFMHRVDNKNGYPHWHVNGETAGSENPDFWAALPLDERGVLKLNGDLAVELALLHSPDYQRQLETLYLSALDVSAERFRFDTQFFGGHGATYTATGEQHPTGQRSELRLDTDASLQRAFTTGGDLVVNFANAMVFNFNGTDSQSINSVLDFTLVQPLLRFAGRDRVMETLTRSERILLYNVRQMERYRRGFYVDIMTGSGGVSGPSRAGGVFGGSGLQGFTGTGTGFGALGGGGGGGGTQGFGGAGAGAASAGGFMGLLQDQLTIQNQEDNITRLRDNLLRLEETLVEMLTTIPETQEDIPRQRLQVAQARQALFNAESQLLNARAQYQQTLDGFKVTLGLPPKLCVEISDDSLGQFNLFDPEIVERRNEVDQLRQSVGGLNIRILSNVQEVEDPETNSTAAAIVWDDSIQMQLGELRDLMFDVDAVADALLEENVPRVEEDIARLSEEIPKRDKESARLRREIEQNADEICALLPTATFDPAVLDVEPLRDLPQTLSKNANNIEGRIASYRERAATVRESIDRLLREANDPNASLDPRDLFQRLRDEVILGSQDVLSALAEDVLAYQLIQARARVEAISLVPIDLSEKDAMNLAREYRRDWMNAQAALVDRWRLIEFNADALESDLDVVFNGDIRTVGNNPLAFNDSTGRLQVGFRFDAPFTRLLERNTYRQALIEFQQQRRSYYQFIDGVATTLRGELRTIQRNQLNFEVQRYAVRTAAEQIDLNEDIRKIREAGGLSSGPTAARDTVSALSDLLSAQNNFLSVWVNYEVLRRRLDLDLGTMQLDERGLWIDPGPVGGEYGLPMPLAGGACAPESEITPGDGPSDETETIEARPLPNRTPRSLPGPDAPPIPPVDRGALPLPVPRIPSENGNSPDNSLRQPRTLQPIPNIQPPSRIDASPSTSDPTLTPLDNTELPADPANTGVRLFQPTSLRRR